MLEGKKQVVGLNGKISKEDHHHPNYMYKIFESKEAEEKWYSLVFSEYIIAFLSRHPKGK